MRKFSPYVLWAILSLPGLGLLVGLLISGDPNKYEDMLHPTGEFAARFLIIAMMATPLSLLLKGWRGPRWLKKNRRYFGVAAFSYAFAHTVLYLLDSRTLTRVIDEFGRLDIWTGWVAMFIFVPLAFTSSDYFVRALGANWKKLQRWTYAAAVLTLIHWAALHNWGGVGPAVIHFGPLAALQLYRVWYWRKRRSAAVS